MRGTMKTYIRKVLRDQERRRKTVSILCVLSLLVATGVAWRLRLTGITMTDTASCGQVEHVHGETCVERRLICGLEEGTLVPAEDSAPVQEGAPAEEAAPAEQPAAEPELTCTQAEHTHGDGCYETQRTLICTDESEEHEHTAECYKEERVLVCTQAEHTHGDGCWTTPEPPMAPEVTEPETVEPEAPAMVPHVHTDACYEDVLVCGQEEHIHTLDCYSDPAADKESREDWEETLPELTGDWAEDLVQVAESQLGYAESTENYQLAEDGVTKKGYTRYGDWYGNPYGDWGAMFVSFCLNYAEIPEDAIPQKAGAQTMMSKVDRLNRLAPVKEYEPVYGDLVFMDQDENGFADLVGVVVDSSGEQFRIIAGDVDGMVAEQTVQVSDPAICGVTAVSEAYEAALLAEEEEMLADAGEKFDESKLNLLSDTAKKNAWQIVSGEYNSDFDWTYNDEENVRMRKEVMSTDKENEFYIYMEVQNKMSWADILENADHISITTSNDVTQSSKANYGVTVEDGLVEPSSGKVGTLFFNEEDAKATGKSYNEYQFILRKWATPSTANPEDAILEDEVKQVCYGTIPNCNNGTVYFPLSSINHTFLCGPVQFGASSDVPFILDVYESNGQGDSWEFSTETVDFVKLTDIMGEYIDYAEPVTYDGDISYTDEEGDTVDAFEWSLGVGSKLEEEQEGTVHEYWTSHRILYKISLDVEKEGFYSCAEHMEKTTEYQTPNPKDWIYETNAQTELTYTVTTTDEEGGKTTTEDALSVLSPQVKGLLYDIRLTKHGELDDGTTKPLPGAKFELFAKNGTDPILKADGTPYIVTTTENGVVEFINLPWGDYVLKEIDAPGGYIPSSEEWGITLCYTTDKENLVQDTVYPKNMLWIGNGADWTVLNTIDPYKYSLIVKKTDESDHPLAGAKFELRPNPADPDGYIPIETDATGVVHVIGEFKPNTLYTLTETGAPAGYYPLPGGIEFLVVKDETTGKYTPTVVNDYDGLVTVSLEKGADGDILTITVKNKTGSELPSTGGAGTSLYTFGGLLLMAAPLVYGYMKRRREEMGFGD